MKNSIAISGMGAVSPLGLCVSSNWDNARDGKSGIVSIDVQDGIIKLIKK